MSFNQKPSKQGDKSADTGKENRSSGNDHDDSGAETEERSDQQVTAHKATDGRSPELNNMLKRENSAKGEDDDDPDDQPVIKRRKRNSESTTLNDGPTASDSVPLPKPAKSQSTGEAPDSSEESSGDEEDDPGSEEEKPAKATKKEALHTSLSSSGKDPYPDWKPGDPVPYAALCKTFSLIELTTKRLQISAHCSLFLQQVLRLTPNDLLPTVQLMINKLAADYAGIELGIGESLIIKAISESTGRPLAMTKADHQKIGDLGLVAAKSRSTQGTMFKPKPLTVRGVHEGLLAIAKMEGHGSQEKKVGTIKKLLAAADSTTGTKGIDITKDKGGPSESKFLVRFLEGKLRLGLAEKTVIVALAHAVATHEVAQKGIKAPNADQLAKGEAELKSVFR